MSAASLPFDAHRALLAAYTTGLLNRPTWLEQILHASGILTAVRSVLSIGPGPGELECRLAHRHRLLLGFVERSPVMLEALQRNVERRGLTSKVVAVHRCPFEELESDRRYDLVLAMDSWYHLGCNPRALRKALELRTRGGKLIIELLTRTSPWQLDRARHLPCAEQLSKWATSAGFAHQYFERGHSVSSSTLVGPGGATPAYRQFVSFAAGRAWEELADDERKRAIGLVRSASHNGRIETVYGFLLFDDGR